MKLTRDDGLWMLHFGDNAFAHIENDWRQLFGGYNWSTYRLAHIEYENDTLLGGHEVTVVLLGFGFRFRKNNPNNERMKAMDELVEAIREKDGESQA